MSITKITEMTANAVATRFKNVSPQRFFVIDGKQYSSFDVLNPTMSHRVTPDRWVFDAEDKFVSRNVVLENPRVQGGFKEITTVPGKESGFVTYVKHYNALGEEMGEDSILHKEYELKDLVGGIKGFFAKRKYAPDTIVNLWAKNDKNGQQKAVIAAYTDGGDVNVVREVCGARLLKAAAVEEIEDGKYSKAVILKEINDKTGTINNKKDIYEAIQPGLQKIKNYWLTQKIKDVCAML